jgi:hypothetical protein
VAWPGIVTGAWGSLQLLDPAVPDLFPAAAGSMTTTCPTCFDGTCGVVHHYEITRQRAVPTA